MSAPAQVVVVGAGPVGLFLALMLTRRGVSVRVLERADAAKHDPRAAVIWPRAAEALLAEGLGPAFHQRQAPLTSAELYVRGRLRGSIPLGTVPSAERFPWIVEQHTTEALLVAALREAGVEVEWGTTAEEVVDDGGQVRTRLTQAGREAWLDSDYLVGCDGSRSGVRKGLGVAFEGAPHPRVECLQVNARPRWRFPHVEGRCRFFLAPGATLLAVPLPGGGVRFVSFVSVDDRAAANDALAVTVPELEAAFRKLTLDEGLVLEPTTPGWLSRARFQDRVAQTLRKGRVLLAGDAAHVWAPIGGRGMNLGLLGAQNLAWRLAAVVRDGASPALLDGYSDEHRRWAQGTIARLRWNRTEYPSNAMELLLVGSTMPLASSLGPVRRAIELDLSALPLHHRGSPSVARGGAAGKTRPGDRLPWVPLETEVGAMPSHALLGSGWTLLALGAEAVTEQLASRVQVRRARALDPAAQRALGSAPRLVLVRPDAHVSLVAPLTAPEQVAAHLSALGLATG